MPQGEVDAIIDASALYPLLRRLGVKAAEVLVRFAVLDLTKYEVGNVVWKEYGAGLLKNWEKAMEGWSMIVGSMQKLSIKEEELKEVEGIAIERDVTFYDASYAFIAERKNLKLITEDKDLLNKCRNAITLENFLKKDSSNQLPQQRRFPM